MYKTTVKIGLSRNIVFIITLIFAAYPSLLKWNTELLTESLALSGSILLIYFMVSLWQEEFRVSKVFYILLLTCGLIFLRPSFLYLLPVIFIYGLFFFTKSKKEAASVLCISLISAFAALCYCYEFKQTSGFFNMTIISNFNQLFIAANNDIIDPDAVTNKDLAQRLQNVVQYKNAGNEDAMHGEIWKIWHEFTPNEINCALKEMNKGVEMKNLTKITINHIIKSSSFKLMFGRVPSVFTLGSILWLFIAAIVFFIINYFKTKRVSLLSLTLLLFAMANYAVVIIGAQEEWDRLMVPSLPVCFILVGEICNCFKIQFR